MLKFRTSFSAHAAAVVIGTMLVGGGQALADQVIPDDLIVQGSLCVGFDCVNGESFGFDTIRLKENNLRIMFVDTSTASGFPSRDWQLVANSSANGGENYFGIRDCGTNNGGGGSECGTRTFAVAGGAPANSIFAASTGRVGFRTATPVLDLHVRTGNTPGQRLEQDGSSGFTPQTWDIAGNEANFFVRDVTGGSRLPFRIRPGAPTSSIDIAPDGDVGIGTASPQRNLHVNSTGDSVLRLQSPAGKYDLAVGGGVNIFRIIDNADVPRFAVAGGGNIGIGTNNPEAQLHTTGSVRFAGVAACSSGIQSDAEGDLLCLPSSRRFKRIDGELAPEVALANVMALRSYVGAYKATPHVPEHWLIADEVAEIEPALVGLKDGEPYTVKTYGVIADLVAVIQEQQRRIQALERVIGR